MENLTRRILILENEFGMGGLEKKLFEFIARTDRSRYQISVCCLKQGGYFKGRLEAMGVTFHDNLLRNRYDVLAFRSLAKILRAEHTQLIYTFSHPNTVIFSYFAKRLGLAQRVVVSYHATGHADGGRLVPRYLLPFLRRADALLAVAESQMDYLARAEGLPREKIRVIHNGVDTDEFRPAAASERSDARRALGLADGDLVFMAVASLKPLKCLDLLLRAAAPTLRSERSERSAKLVIVGDGPERDRLRGLSAELGIDSRVVFSGLRDDVNAVLRAADALVLSSRTEAFPNAVLEAMATGLAVITTDVGSVREMVEENRNAIVLRPGDEAALRAAIERVAADAELRRAFGARGREIVEARFRIEAMCAAREALFDELLSSDARASSLAAKA